MFKEKIRNSEEQYQRDLNIRFFEKLNIEFLIHELKDPVAVIETALRTMVDQREIYGPLSSRQEATLKRTLLCSKKIHQMLDDLLEIGRGQTACFIQQKFAVREVAFKTLIEALEIQSYPIFKKIEQSTSSDDKLKYLASHGIYFLCDKKVKDLEIIQDEIKFRQIVINLIKNALYHRDELVEIRLRLHDSRLILTVGDDGPGVAPEYHQLIFNQYMQINDKLQMSRCGYGLGLSGARILARCLGGDIKIQSHNEQGAVFHLTLPITSREV
jgi:signal transduction histidine kinase